MTVSKGLILILLFVLKNRNWDENEFKIVLHKLIYEMLRDSRRYNSLSSNRPTLTLLLNNNQSDLPNTSLINVTKFAFKIL